MLSPEILENGYRPLPVTNDSEVSVSLATPMQISIAQSRRTPRSSRRARRSPPPSRRGRARAGEVVPVRLRAHVTEIGTLELECVGRGESWSLEWSLRQRDADAAGDAGGSAAGKPCPVRASSSASTSAPPTLRRRLGGPRAQGATCAAPSRTFPVPQLVAPGRGGARGRLLPSCVYLPGARSCRPRRSRLPWGERPLAVVGELARAQGARVPGRLVTLREELAVHPGVDRAAPILPVGRAGGRAAALAVEASALLPRAPARRLGRTPTRSAPLARAGGRAHRARVVRRGGARAHRRGRARGGLGRVHPARGAAGGLLRLAGAPPRGDSGAGAARACGWCWWWTWAAAPPTSR